MNIRKKNHFLQMGIWIKNFLNFCSKIILTNFYLKYAKVLIFVENLILILCTNRYLNSEFCECFLKMKITFRQCLYKFCKKMLIFAFCSNGYLNWKFFEFLLKNHFNQCLSEICRKYHICWKLNQLCKIE